MPEELTTATDAEHAQQKRRTENALELDAMRTAFNALDMLSETARWRAMAWLSNALRAIGYPDDEVPF